MARSRRNRDFRGMRNAMDEALTVQVAAVERPTAIKGVSEQWLEVTYQGKHVGWLPIDTNPQVAMNTARRWLKEDRGIAADAAKVAMPSVAGTVLNKLMERA